MNLKDIVGGGYGTFWNFKGRYRVVKGSRRSKKSKTTALWAIVKIMEYPEANMLVVRKTFRTLKDSCFTELKWAIHRLGVDKWWSVKESPLEMTYKPTGQKIYFRGLDDPLKITSIATEIGVLCWMWIEEAYEIDNEADFDTLAESMLGYCPEGLFNQITLTFNPWSEHHWIKARFFDQKSQDVYAATTNYLCNEWLSDADKAYFERMKEDNPRRYRVAGLGDWGVSEGLIYENWKIDAFCIDDILSDKEHGWKYRCVYGLDYGYTNDPTAFIAAAVNPEDKLLYVFDEHYQTRMVNSEIAAMITAKGFAKERIRADAAEPKSNEELRRAGISRVQAAEKGKDSILHGIAVLQEYTIIVHPLCKNTAAELSAYAWDTNTSGDGINRPVDKHNHLMDALRYAMTDVARFRPQSPQAAKEARKTAYYTSRASGNVSRDMQGGWN